MVGVAPRLIYKILSEFLVATVAGHVVVGVAPRPASLGKAIDSKLLQGMLWWELLRDASESSSARSMIDGCRACCGGSCSATASSSGIAAKPIELQGKG